MPGEYGYIFLYHVKEKEVGKALVYDGVGESIEDYRELHGGVGNTLSHRRCEKVPVVESEAVEKIAVLGAWRLAVAKRYHNHRDDAFGEPMRTTQRSEEGQAKKTRSAAVFACFGEGGDNVREDANAIEEKIEEGEKCENCGVVL